MSYLKNKTQHELLELIAGRLGWIIFLLVLILIVIGYLQGTVESICRAVDGFLC